MAQTFEPPKYLVPYTDWLPWARYKYPRGSTILKTGGVYTQYVDNVDDALLTAADVIYLGGHSYVVSDTEAAALAAAGYASGLAVPPAPGGGPADPPDYGSGAYGAGIYGA